MNPDEFIQCGQRAFGKVGWQRQTAEALGMAKPTISKYATGRAPIPTTVALAIRSLAPLHQVAS